MGGQEVSVTYFFSIVLRSRQLVQRRIHLIAATNRLDYDEVA